MKRNKTDLLFLGILLFSLPFCAKLHHIQIGELTNTQDFEPIPFDIQIKDDAIILGSDSKAVNTTLPWTLYFFSKLLSPGPTTGGTVAKTTYADQVLEEIIDNCPSGKVTGITSMRESRSFSMLSGEIVEINGYCLQ